MRFGRSPLERFAQDRSGAVLVYVGLSLPVMLALTALAVDFGHVYLERNHLQIAADAAALAGAARLPDAADVLSEATEFAIANIPDVGGTTVLAADDVVIGNWDGDTFTAAGVPANAVRAVTRRAAANSNALPTTFGVLLGTNAFNLSRTAVAVATPEDCLIQGMVANGIVEIGSGNTLGGVCMHGQNGAKIGSDNDFTDASLSMNDLDDLEASSPNPGLDGALEQRNLPPTDALNIDSILAEIKAGDGVLPDYLTGAVSVVSSLPSTRVAGTLYIVSNDVTLSGNVSGFGVYSTKKITISSNANLQNMFLAAEENVEAGSYITFGGPNYCTDGTGSVFMAAADQVKLGSNNSFTGTQIIAGNYVDMGSDLLNVAGLSVQSGGDIKLGSTVVSECDQVEHVLLGGSAFVLRLVQ